jgi:hypothetical protein
VFEVRVITTLSIQVSSRYSYFASPRDCSGLHRSTVSRLLSESARHDRRFSSFSTVQIISKSPNRVVWNLPLECYCCFRYDLGANS